MQGIVSVRYRRSQRNHGLVRLPFSFIGGLSRGRGGSTRFLISTLRTVQNQGLQLRCLRLDYASLRQSGQGPKDMARKPEKKTPKTPEHKLYPARMILDVDENRVEGQKLDEIAGLIKLPSSLSEANKNARIARALDLYERLEPVSGLEGMLAAQMVEAHHAALECLRMAVVLEQTFAGRDMNLKHAAKLMALYSQQVAALDKHRGKGQQKVTVEHVHVAAGGQAIVGNVERGEASQAMPPNPAQVEHLPEFPVDFGAEKAPSRRRKPKAE